MTQKKFLVVFKFITRRILLTQPTQAYFSSLRHFSPPPKKKPKDKKVKNLFGGFLNFVSAVRRAHREPHQTFCVTLPIREGRTNSINSDTVKPRNNGCQGTNKLHLLLADFHYSQHRKKKRKTKKNHCLAFLIGGFPLFLGPV